MKVPPGIHVDTRTKQLLEELPERAEVQEVCMQLADTLQVFSTAVTDLSAALRNYAGEDSCVNAKDVAHRTEKLGDSWRGLELVILAQVAMHSIHHDHSAFSGRSYREQVEEATPDLHERIILAKGTAALYAQKANQDIDIADVLAFIFFGSR